jgi:hypothetical protein
MNRLSAAPSRFYLGTSLGATVYMNPDSSANCLGLTVIDMPYQPAYLPSDPCFRLSPNMLILGERIKSMAIEEGPTFHRTSCIRHHTKHVNWRIPSHQWWSSHQISGLCRFHRLLGGLHSVSEPLISPLTFSLLGPAVWRMVASGSRTIIIVRESKVRANATDSPNDFLPCSSNRLWHAGCYRKWYRVHQAVRGKFNLIDT